ncbi:MAG: DUF1566 domain-containing protein [Gammaproteobacteria bacterium]|nr:DUF1566 domain-containing protein [Gammaproteobacteria bacterium]
MKRWVWILCLLSGLVQADDQCGVADDRFDVRNDGTILDKKTKLQWMQCSLGMQWQQGECTGRALRYDWSRVQDEVGVINSSRGFANATGWRLPTQVELESLIDKRCYDPTVNSQYFSRTVSAGYWTSTGYPGYNGGMMLVYFLHGQSYLANKERDWFVRLVR